MHLTDKEYHIRYLADSKRLVLLAKIRNAIPQRNKTTRGNTDTRLAHNVSFEENLNRQIAIGELGWGGALKVILGYMEMAPHGAMAHKIQELDDLMTMRNIDRKRGRIEDKISKLLVCGDQRMHGALIKNFEENKGRRQLKIGEVLRGRGRES